MINRIWVTKLTRERATSNEKYAFAFNGKPESVNKCSSNWSYLGCEPFNTGVQEHELFEIIIDTETQKYEVKRPRGIGWYLTERVMDNYAVARYWDGEFWCVKPNESQNYDNISDSRIKVVSEIIRDNEYLKGLE